MSFNNNTINEFVTNQSIALSTFHPDYSSQKIHSSIDPKCDDVEIVLDQLNVEPSAIGNMPINFVGNIHWNPPLMPVTFAPGQLE